MDRQDTRLVPAHISLPRHLLKTGSLRTSPNLKFYMTPTQAKASILAHFDPPSADLSSQIMIEKSQ